YRIRSDGFPLCCTLLGAGGRIGPERHGRQHDGLHAHPGGLMPYRYLATLDPDGHADDDATTPENCGLVSGGPGAMRLFASADTPTLLTPDGGILVGRLFGADGTPVRRTTDLPMIVSPAQFRRFVLERCWGEYVLFQAEATAAPAITITRDPSGGVACVCSLERAPRFVTSDISLATHHGL